MNRFLLTLGLMFGSGLAYACDLCAVYNTEANGGSAQGLTLSIAEQYIPYKTVQLNGEELPPSILDEAFVDSSISHLVPTWNFSDRFGLSLNVPYVHKQFFRFQRTGTGVGSRKPLGRAGPGSVCFGVGRGHRISRAQRGYIQT